MAGLRIEQECPQCGGRMDLEETDRLVACDYCGVKSFLHSTGLFRFVIGHNAPGREIVYVPYLRFKGSVFSCTIQGVAHRIVDFSRLGTPFKSFPFSLGIRPQTLKMRFADRNDAVYRALFRAIVQGKRELDDKPRIDMAGATPAPYPQDFGHLYRGGGK